MQSSQVLPHRSRRTISVWTSLCARGHGHAETGKGLPQTVATKLEAQISSGMSLYAAALRFHFTGMKGSSLNHEKQPQTIIPPPPNMTVAMNAFAQVAFSWHPPNSDLSIGLPGGEACFITPENPFPLVQSPMVVSFPPLQLTLGIVHGDPACMRLLGHGNPFHEALAEQCLC